MEGKVQRGNLTYLRSHCLGLAELELEPRCTWLQSSLARAPHLTTPSAAHRRRRSVGDHPTPSLSWCRSSLTHPQDPFIVVLEGIEAPRKATICLTHGSEGHHCLGGQKPRLQSTQRWLPREWARPMLLGRSRGWSNHLIFGCAQACHLSSPALFSPVCSNPSPRSLPPNLPSHQMRLQTPQWMLVAGVFWALERWLVQPRNWVVTFFNNLHISLKADTGCSD